MVAGALVTKRADEELWSRVQTIRHDQGAILGPFEAWLLTRGLRTLHLRVRASCGNAMHLAAHLQHLAPQAVLARGYAIARDERGRVLRNAASVPEGSAVSVQLADGRLDTRVLGHGEA